MKKINEDGEKIDDGGDDDTQRKELNEIDVGGED